MQFYSLNTDKIVFQENFYVANNTPAIRVLCLSEWSNEENPFFEIYGTLSVCIPEKDIHLEKNEIIVKTWSENEVFCEFITSRLFEDTGKRIPTGFVQAEIWKKTENYYKYLIKD